MVIAIVIVLLVLFSVLMFTSEGVDDSSKRVALALCVVGVVWILFKLV